MDFDLPEEMERIRETVTRFVTGLELECRI